MNTRKEAAFVFPAFAMRYKAPGEHSMGLFEQERAGLAARAANVVALDHRKLATPSAFALADGLEDNLQDHYVCYINSCAIARALNNGSQCALPVALVKAEGSTHISMPTSAMALNNSGKRKS